MAKSSILIDLNDPRTAKIADVISNKTTKKILSLLAEQELSKTQLSKLLNSPLNTIEYNINKLEESGLIEKTKGFLWSAKGKRIHHYKVSNKTITISPKSLVKGIIPSVIITAILALIIKFFLFSKSSSVQEQALLKQVTPAADYAFQAAESSQPAAPIVSAISSNQNTWLWFLLGALSALFIFLIWNYMKSKQN